MVLVLLGRGDKDLEVMVVMHNVTVVSRSLLGVTITTPVLVLEVMGIRCDTPGLQYPDDGPAQMVRCTDRLKNGGSETIQ